MAKQEQAVSLCKIEILHDIKSGVVPSSIVSFSDLHDYVDANEYGGATDSGSPYNVADMGIEFWAGVQDVVHEWLASGRPS